MDPRQETEETWNKIAALYEEKFMDLDLYNESFDDFCNSIIKKNARILDIACGPGNITKYLLKKRPDFKILGIDLAPNMIKLARKNNPTATFDVLDCRQIRQISEKFDGIICGFCLPYLSPDECFKLISDSFALLEEQGIIYLSFVEGDPERSGFLAGSSGDRTYFYYHESDKLIARLEDNGFAESKILRIKYKKSGSESDLHAILMAGKFLPAH